MFGRIPDPYASGTEAYIKICGPPPGKFLHTTHGRTHYILEGPANAKYLAILQVGISSDTYTMGPMSKALVDTGKFQVLRFEFYDRGYSETDPKRYPILSVGRHPLEFTAEIHVEQTRDVLKGLGLTDKPLLYVGHSMGGLAGLCYAGTYPEQVKGLILMDPVCLPVSKALLAHVADLPCIGEILVKLFGLATLKDFIRNSCDNPKHPEMAKIQQWEISLADQSPRFFAAIRSTNGHSRGMTGSAEPDFRKCCRSPQKFPIHLVWGEDDEPIPFVHCELMKRIAEEEGTPITVTSYPGVGHNVYMADSKPKECIEEVLAFAEKHLK